MNTSTVILLGGAAALLYYCKKVKGKRIVTGTALAPAMQGSAVSYTTQQSQAAAQWWSYAGSWSGSS